MIRTYETIIEPATPEEVTAYAKNANAPKETEAYPWMAGFEAALDASLKFDGASRDDFPEANRANTVRGWAGVYACKPEEIVESTKYKTLISTCGYALEYIVDEHDIDETGDDAFRFMVGVNDYVNTVVNEGEAANV